MKHPELDYSTPAQFTLRERLELAVVPRLISALLKLLCLTCRVRVRNGDRFENLRSRQAAAGVAFWHESLGIALWHFRRSGYHTLTSYSYDGELAARLCEQFGIHALRGSSSRGGAKALRELEKCVKLGIITGFTLDGPKGPRRVAKPGMALLAAKTGVSVMPTAMSATPCWRLRSWDRMCIPKPFSTITVAFGEPVVPPSELSSETLEKFRKTIEQELLTLHADIEPTE